MDNYHFLVFAAFFLSSIFGHVISKDNGNKRDCPSIYQRFSKEHTYCQPKNPRCKILHSNVNQEEIDTILKLHNDYRSQIALQKKGSNGLPAAADMLYMEWDSELAAIAQRHADQCKYQHDEASQRRVKNFDVGQNIGKQSLSGTNVSPPKPDWPTTIKRFFDEIRDVTKKMICGSREQPGYSKIKIGHFTQMVWSKTYRIGCGYTMFKKGKKYTSFYVCNYGPQGNDKKECIYKIGPACQKCPENTKCSKGQGLCKRINNEAPYQKITVPTIFNCNFINRASPDCEIKILGDGTWNYIKTIGDNFMETVLQPGHNTTIVFSKHIIPSPSAENVCVEVQYRKGPALAKDSRNHKAKVMYFYKSKSNRAYVVKLPEGDYPENFGSYEMTFIAKPKTEIKISFAVPDGATPQYFNVASVIGFDNECQSTDTNIFFNHNRVGSRSFFTGGRGKQFWRSLKFVIKYLSKYINTHNI